MQDRVVPKFAYMAVHPNDIVVATDDVAGQDVVVPTLAENTGCEGINAVHSGMIVNSGQAEDIEPASTNLSSTFFTITLAW
jgi:hypothetical protein